MTSEEYKQKFESLKSSIAAVDEKLKASIDQTSDPRINDLYNYISYVSRQCDSMWNMMADYQYSHQKGHMPAIKSAGKLQNVLNKLDLADDYQVDKPCIYASKHGFEVDLTNKFKK